MSKVTKRNGIYILDPDPKIVAKSKSAEDQSKLKAKLSDAELREILDRIMTRLEAIGG